jgi:hypothetical protein
MQPIFARITKVDEETRTVTGRAAQEVVDRDNEIFDYITSKPEFMRWSAEVSADTAGKSLGNVRSMHGNIAAGKLTNIDFNDVEKAIDVSAKIIDDNEWDKVMEGVHTGFSIGGRYARKWAEPINGKMVQRYTAVPTEISIVDRPCCPTAKFFSIHKTDGSVIQKFFKNQIELDTDGKILFKGGPGSGPHGGSGKKGGGNGKTSQQKKYESKALEHSNNAQNEARKGAGAPGGEGVSERAGRMTDRANASKGTFSERATLHDHAAEAHQAAQEFHQDYRNEEAANAHGSAAEAHTQAAAAIRNRNG